MVKYQLVWPVYFKLEEQIVLISGVELIRVMALQEEKLDYLKNYIKANFKDIIVHLISSTLPMKLAVKVITNLLQFQIKK